MEKAQPEVKEPAFPDHLREALRAVDPAHYRLVDADGLGLVNMRELFSALRAALVEPDEVTPAMVQPLFDAFDALRPDCSGHVAYEELPRLLEKDTFDTLVTLMERRAARMLAGWKKGDGTAALLAPSGRAGALQVSTVQLGGFEAYELQAGWTPPNRGASRLAVVTFSISGGRSRPSPAALVAQCELSRALVEAGWSVLAYEAAPLSAPEADGEAEVAKLRAAFAYIRAHRSFRYCRVALLAQGAGASAAFVAIGRHPEEFEYRLRTVAAFEPGSGGADHAALPTLLAARPSNRETRDALRGYFNKDAKAETSSMSRLASRLRGADAEVSWAQGAVALQASLNERGTPVEHLEVPIEYPDYGRAHRAHGRAFFTEHKGALLQFLEQHI